MDMRQKACHGLFFVMVGTGIAFTGCGGDSGGATPPGTGDGGTGGAGTDGGTTSWWQPRSDEPIHWHWQLTDDFVYPRDVLPNVSVYDIDGELTPASIVSSLHGSNPNVKVICYVEAGAWEDFRSDKDQFPASIIGSQDGSPKRKWLDIRQLDVLLPIIKNRMVNWCKNKGFDAIEPDETEVWTNKSGFPITKEDNTAYNKAIADLAHSIGLSVGLKCNNTESVTLEPYFDWALTEQCWERNECTFFKDGFLAKGKAVFNVEYDVPPNCATANSWKMNSSQRDTGIDGPQNSDYLYKPCVPDSQNNW